MTSIIWKSEFMANAVYENEIVPNLYKVKVDLVPNTADIMQQNIALERLKTMVEGILGMSLLCGIENPILETLLEKTDNKVVFLPDEPYDQLLAIVLHSKLSCILEERFFIDYISVCSYLGGDLEYIYDSAVLDYPPIITAEIVEKHKAWWARPDMSTMDIITEKDGKRELHLQEIDWPDIELGWDSDVEKEGKIIQIKKFKPEVVEGKPNEKSSNDKEQ